MSWPSGWQMQPSYAGYTTGVQPQAAPMATTAIPNSYTAMAPDQYAQWQQWQQYQQQYAQWHAQYGEQYARQMGKPLPAVAAPMPMTAMGMPTNVPPPAIVPTQMAPVMPLMTTAPPIPIGAAPPPPSEPHPDTLSAGQAPAPPPPSSEDPSQVQKTAEELAFDEQFRKWEEEFDNWKRKNANHPDKATYREYEKKFEDCRKKLVERREYLRKKRIAEAERAKAGSIPNTTANPVQIANYQHQSQYNQPPPPPPPEQSGEMDVGLFKNALGGGGVNSGGGIPGLDLIGESGQILNQRNDDVVEVIDLDDEKEEKPNVHQLNASMNKPSNPVNALASLLKDPKVSALLNVISANANGEGVNLSSIGNSELLQQIQNAAGAVINANQNGSSGLVNQNQSAWPGAQPSLNDERSRSSFHEDHTSIQSGDERSRDVDECNRNQYPGLFSSNYNRCPPPGDPNNFNRVPPPIDFNRGPPPVRNIDGSFRGPPGRDFENFNRDSLGNNFDSPNRGPPGRNFDDSNRGRDFDNPNWDAQRGGTSGSFQRGPMRGPEFDDFNRSSGPDTFPKRNSLSGRDFDDFGRGPPQGYDDLGASNRGPPPVSGPGDFSRVPPPATDLIGNNRGPPNLRAPPGTDFGPPGHLNRNEQRNTQAFNAKVPPPLMDVDLSRPPPMFSSQPVRSQRSEQSSPALSNTSSVGGKQRNSLWGDKTLPGIKQESNPVPFEKQTLQPMKDEPFNGSDFPDDEDPSLYDGHADELQIDPELGRPCAVPKPDWMEEDEYQEIFDRFEHIQVFEERKFRMETAIRLLEHKKKAERKFGAAGSFAIKPLFGSEPPGLGNKPSFGSEPSGLGKKPVDVGTVKSEFGNIKPPEFGNGSNSNNNSNTSSRWQGGMPKPLKQEPTNYKRANPFADEDDIFRPKQVIDYSNGIPRVIDYGHSSSGGTQDWFNRGSLPGERGHSHNDGLQPQRFDYNHSNSTAVGPAVANLTPFCVDRPAHYTESSINRLTSMHNNPNPEESNPCYPSKFILMNDNRPNRPRTKRGKRASSIRKQKLRQDDEIGNPEDSNNVDEPNQELCKSDAPQLSPPKDYELEMKRGSDDYPKNLAVNPIVLIDDLLLPPGRFKRHPRICFILRGIPGSGKSYLARMIKECEVKNGGQAPRVLSIDDYFLVENEEREPDPITGRPVLITKSEYQFDAEMEEVYMQNLVKAFKRTITEQLYNFVIVDCVNERLQHYNEFHNFARSNGFKESITSEGFFFFGFNISISHPQVYTCTMQTDIDLCIEQNIHKRTGEEIKAYAEKWALGPSDHVLINACTLLDPNDNNHIVPADMDLCTEEDDQPQSVDAVEPNHEVTPEPQDIDEDSNIDVPELGFFASKWDTDTTEQNLARLDGISKPPRRPPTIEDFLQMDGDDFGTDDCDTAGGASSSGKKRVRWADIEERKAQRKMRQMGFVVGVTDWSRMMDPTEGGSALTKTKYIERVRRNF
ncbi:YLP motif-containing protein 1-like [Malaya genurostris]|uniref:YLP motif-containing protein 1-like n=1 Tax=Malaya genurostris TaxID=325434 RepID=UPI0026F404D4|nr:YLP motif-containing protein 1-like [Malaya genurostris]XP_058452632.1 YLP motif-containing protein 1-like [Malaya genurostris]